MKPPYDITPEILKLVSSISSKLGEANAHHLSRPSPQLRKQNKIQTIHSSLQIEGNSLSLDQITAIIENKRIIGPVKDIKEVQNAILVYEMLDSLNPYSGKSFLKAHEILVDGLVENPGKYRNKNVGIIKGSEISHIAPSHENVPALMNDLFSYLKDKNELSLIKSCVFHYEMEFIHPFIDGNGRMGRLWQTLILMKENPVFEYLPLETLISQTQKEYYHALSISDKSGNSTKFIEYILSLIDQALEDLLHFSQRKLRDNERLDFFLSLNIKEFTRKDYMNIFKEISSATASRDLKKGVESGLFEKFGEKVKSIYKII